MNTLMTIAVCLAGSAVLQMVAFFCYSTYHKRKLLKSFSFVGFNDEMPATPTKQEGKLNYAAKSGGKVAALHPSNSSLVTSVHQSKSTSDRNRKSQVAQ